MQLTEASLVISLIPLIILMLPFAIGVAYLAPKMGRNPWLWGILLLIPIVNFVVIYVFLFLVAGAVLDKLNALNDRAKNVTPFG